MKWVSLITKAAEKDDLRLLILGHRLFVLRQQEQGAAGRHVRNSQWYNGIFFRVEGGFPWLC